MSFDIIVLKPGDRDAESLSNVLEVTPFGDAESVREAFESKFPGATTGGFANDEAYSLEVRLANDPVSSAHLTLRFGQTWSASSNEQFIESLGALRHHL